MSGQPAVQNNRNTIIDFAKLVYAFPIMLVHSNHLMQQEYHWTLATVMVSGYVAVEFFFIISGYLMAQSIQKTGPAEAGRLGSDTVRFVLRKFQIIFPYYLLIFILNFIILHLIHMSSLRQTMKDLVYSLPAFFRINITGMFSYDPIGPAWYISAMLLVMLLLYPLARSHANMFNCAIAPFLALFIYGYISKTRGNIGAATVWIGLMNVGVLRAVAGLSLGCACFEINRKFSALRLTNAAKTLLTVVEGFCYIVPLAVMSIVRYSQVEFILIFMFAAAITLSFSRQTWSGKLFKKPHPWMSQLSLTIFLSHKPIADFTNWLFPAYDQYQRLPYFIAISLLVAYICMRGGYITEPVQEIFQSPCEAACRESKVNTIWTGGAPEYVVLCHG